MTQDTEGYAGLMGPYAQGNEFNATSFLIKTLIGKMATATLVQVVNVTNEGDVSPVGFVDVHPMVAQINGKGIPTPHGVIYGLPYMRLQGGANAVILDPQVGDIGVAVFCAQDISKVKATKADATPGSRRRFDLADGIYFGGVLNGTPTQYVRFDTDGITLVSPTKVRVDAPTLEVHGDITATGTITGDADVKSGTIRLRTHKHTGVTTGGGTSGGPTA
jgi:hypothetical protein